MDDFFFSLTLPNGAKEVTDLTWTNEAKSFSTYGRQVQIRRSDTHLVDIVRKRQVVCRWKSSLDCVTNVTPECFMWKKWHKSTMWSKLEIQFEFHDVNSSYFYVPLRIMAKLVSLIGNNRNIRLWISFHKPRWPKIGILSRLSSIWLPINSQSIDVSLVRMVSYAQTVSVYFSIQEWPF